MVKIESQINFVQIKRAIRKLPVRDRAKLIEDLLHDRATWREEFRRLLGRIEERVKKFPISQKEINEIVEQAREEYHVKNRR